MRAHAHLKLIVSEPVARAPALRAAQLVDADTAAAVPSDRPSMVVPLDMARLRVEWLRAHAGSLSLLLAVSALAAVLCVLWG